MKCHHCGAPLEPVCSYCGTRHVRVVKHEVPMHVMAPGYFVARAYTKPNPRGFVAQLGFEVEPC